MHVSAFETGKISLKHIDFQGKETNFLSHAVVYPTMNTKVYRLGRSSSAQHFKSQPAGFASDPEDGPVGFAFWHSVDEQDLHLPEVDKVGLATAISNGGFGRVVLLTYQQLQSLPEGVEIQDARQHLSEESFKNGLQNLKLPIPLLSDFIRLLAIRKFSQETHKAVLQMQYSYECLKLPIQLKLKVCKNTK